MRIVPTVLRTVPTVLIAQDPGPFYHGTRASLKVGDYLKPGNKSNYGENRIAKYVYFTATVDAAVWGAELALGEAPGKIYRVEPTGSIEDDPNLTNKKFPGNPTRSYRSSEPLLIVGELQGWEGHTPEALLQMRENLEKLSEAGLDTILL